MSKQLKITNDVIIQEYELLSIDGGTYLIRHYKNRIIMKCQNCQTKNREIEVEFEYLQQMLDYKTMKRV